MEMPVKKCYHTASDTFFVEFGTGDKAFIIGGEDDGSKAFIGVLALPKAVPIGDDYTHSGITDDECLFLGQYVFTSIDSLKTLRNQVDKLIEQMHIRRNK